MTRETIPVIEQLREIARFARTGDYGNAAAGLNRCIPALQHELSRGKIDAKGIAKITYSLETLTIMQSMNDWVAFADILEYEFIALWQQLTKT